MDDALLNLASQEQRTLLTAIADYEFNHGKPISGKRLRRELAKGQAVANLQANLGSVIPQLITLWGQAPNDSYSLTLLGLLNSRRAGEVAKLIEHLLSFFRRLFRADPDVTGFRYEEVAEFFKTIEQPVPEPNALRTMISAARLDHGGSHSDSGFHLHVPIDIEAVIACTTIGEFVDLHNVDSAPSGASVAKNSNSATPGIIVELHDYASGEPVATHYEIKEKIGVGFEGDVWLVTDTRLQRDVAIKFFAPPGSRADEDALSHARNLARVQDENIVRVYSVERIRHPRSNRVQYAVVMEYVDGIRLLDLAPGGCTIEEAKAYGLGIIGGIRALHNAGIPHGDLHKQNVLLAGGRAKIIDPVLSSQSLAGLGTRTAYATVQEDVRDARRLLAFLIEAACCDPNRYQSFLYDAEAGDGGLDELEVLFTERLHGDSFPSSQGALPHANVVSVADLVDTIKEWLPNHACRIQLADLVRRETDLVVDHFRGYLGTHQHINEREALVRILNECQSGTERLRALLRNGCYWDDDAQTPLWTGSVERVANARPDSHTKFTEHDLRRYPALLCLYSAGIGAVTAKRWSTLLRLFEGKFRESYRQPEPLGVQLTAYNVVHDGVARLLQNRIVPLSDHLHAFLGMESADILPEADDYTEAFDRFEYYLSLYCADYLLQNSSFRWGPPGCFVYRGEDVNHMLSDVTRKEVESRSRTGILELLAAGFFGGDQERLVVAKTTVDEAAARLNPWRRRA